MSGVTISNGNDNHDKNDDDVLGCEIRKGDTQKVIASLACYASFIVYGASAALLGSALPEMCQYFNVTEKEFGIAFTLRGTGYFAGTFASAGILEIKRFALSKQLIVCSAVALTGLANGMLTISTTFDVAMFLFFLQGIGFGFIDTFANCVMPELWGRRVQPWMQALHSWYILYLYSYFFIVILILNLALVLVPLSALH